MKKLILFSFLITVVPAAHAMRGAGGSANAPLSAAQQAILQNAQGLTAEEIAQINSLKKINTAEDLLFKILSEKDFTPEQIDAMINAPETQAQLSSIKNDVELAKKEAESAKKELDSAKNELGSVKKELELAAKIFQSYKTIVEKIPAGSRSSVLGQLLSQFPNDIIPAGSNKIPFSALLKIIGSIKTYFTPQELIALGITAS